MIRIALAQINPTVGDLKNNHSTIIKYIKKAKKNKVDLVIFPELALTGYPPEDLILKRHFILENKKFLNSLRKVCKDIVVLVGFLDQDKHSVYNSCAVIQDCKIKDIYRKIILPNYGVFDEKRYFSSGNTLPVYEFLNYRFGLSICEDIWTKEVVGLFKKEKPDFIINISASPFYFGKISLREKMLSQAAKQANSFIFYCNLVGGQDEVVFDGSSEIFSSQGKRIAAAMRFSQDLCIFDFDKKKKYPSLNVKATKENEAFSALLLGLYDYVNKNNFKKVVVGLSGGIDSAVVVSLACLALGQDNVCALIMPSTYTSKATFYDAKKICKNLGIDYHIVRIDKIFNMYQKSLKDHFKGRKKGKTEENIQARIRGNILMAFSNKFGYLVLNTGNKSEVSCGYCTLYGDMVGGFGVLKDVPKTLVYKLASYINNFMKKKIIPDSVIKRAPSAELRRNQKDTDALPAYELLDPIIKLYVEEDLSSQDIVKRGYKKDLVQKIIAMVDANEYKRRQAPIGIKITPRAFGKDRRMPITNRFFK